MNSTSCACRLVSIAGQVAGLLDDRAGGGAHRHAHLVGDDVGQRRLAEAGRAVEQHVIERLAPAAGRGNRHLQVVADAVLADVLVERARAQAGVVLRVVVGGAPVMTRSVMARSLPALASAPAAPPSAPVRTSLAARRQRGLERPSRPAADDSRGSAAPRAGRRAADRSPTRAAVASPAPTPSCASAVLQLEHDALGGLLADAGDAGEPRHVAALHAGDEIAGLHAGQHAQRPASGRCR